ncbi:MAG: hypothetical protein AAF547_16205 [Actinomycetota bacterium]
MSDRGAWTAIAELYHRFLTGSLLAMVVRSGTDRAERVVFRIFRTQHLDLFLPGLAKLELDDLPDAVACAKYHVLSNSIGGVDVVWIPDSDRRSWVRYRPPRWIWDGTAVCGIPTELSRAMLRGWHGHNGASLDNPRLGFVCTMQTTDGQPGLEGYYVEEDEPLDEADKVRFRPGERPPGPPAELALPTWPPDRLAKAERNYAAAYVANLLEAMPAELGPGEAVGVGALAARQVAMQYHGAVMDLLGPDPGGGSDDLAARLARLIGAQGDEVVVERSGDEAVIRLSSWRLAGPGRADQRPRHPAAFDIWNGLWDGLAAMEDRRLVVEARLDHGDPATVWRLPAPSA